MKKIIVIILALCLYLSGCNLVPGNIQQTGDTQTSAQENKAANNQTAQNNQNAQDKTNNQSKDAANNAADANSPAGGSSKPQSEVNKSNDASVEALLHLGEDFLDAAFTGDVDDMISFCSNSLADDIEKNPKKFIGTKTDYKLDKVDTTIKSLGEGKYLLMSVASAAKKTDKEKKLYDFKYSATVEKVKGDYYIIDFKRDSK